MALCIHNCGNRIGPNSRLNECTICRHALYYWRKKRPAQIIERRRKLDVYASRLEEHFDTHGKVTEQSKSRRPSGNVVQFKPRKRA